MKPYKKHTPKKDAAHFNAVRDYLRKNAPQVKFIMIDNLFTGEITLTERESFKTKPGYKQVERKFKDFDEVKKHYAVSSKARIGNAKPRSSSRNKPKGNSRSTKESVARKQPKGRHSRPDNVQPRKAGRKVRRR